MATLYGARYIRIREFISNLPHQRAKAGWSFNIQHNGNVQERSGVFGARHSLLKDGEQCIGALRTRTSDSWHANASRRRIAASVEPWQ